MPGAPEAQSEFQKQATNLSKPVQQGGKFESSYTRIMKSLAETQYKLSEKADKDVFIDIVLLDAKAARLKKQTREKIEPTELNNAIGKVNALLMKMSQTKGANSFHGKFTQDFAPLQGDAKQRALEADELVKEVDNFVANLKAFDGITKDKSKDEIKQKISEIQNQWASIQKRINNLGDNIETLLQRMDGISGEIKGVMPQQGVQAGAAPTPE